MPIVRDSKVQTFIFAKAVEGLGTVRLPGKRPQNATKYYCLVLLWVQNHFCRVLIVLDGANSFWMGPNNFG